MREIKFRVFSKEQNKFLKIRDFIEKSLQYQFNGVAGYRDICISSYRISENGEFHSTLIHSGNRFKIEQFTGIYDKHGTEIYEGDIVKFDDGEIAEVVFFCGAFMTKLKKGECVRIDYDAKPIWKDGEIIGNIHENSELLGGQND